MERRDIPGPIGPNGRVPDSVNDPRFPKVVDRTKREPLPTALDIADAIEDPVTFKSVSRMIAGE